MVTAMESRLTDEPLLNAWHVQQVSVITTIGEIVGGLTRLTAQIFEVLDGIQVLAVTQNPAGCGLSLVVEPQYAELALTRVHRLTL
jgi:hypothetical protein